MRKYYKCYNESHLGEEGDFYCEVENGLVTRQINAFGGTLFWATPTEFFDENYDFTDQPEFDSGRSGEEQIEVEEFIRI